MKPPFKVESHYKPKLRDDTPDDEWLSLVGENGWTVISHDCRFHKESPASEAIKQFKNQMLLSLGSTSACLDKIGILTSAYRRSEK